MHIPPLHIHHPKEPLLSVLSVTHTGLKIPEVKNSVLLGDGTMNG